MSHSPRLSLPYLAPQQSQKHVVVNEALRRLDALAQISAASAAVAAQPANPSDGDVYILPPGKTGAAWSGMANHALARWIDGAWEEIAPRAGWSAYVADAAGVLYFDGAAWSPLETMLNLGAAAFEDYETGTFTPSFSFTTPGNLSVAYAQQVGRYARLGKHVIGILRCDMTPTHSTASGAAVFGGLPFAAAAGPAQDLFYFTASNVAWPAGQTQVASYLSAGATALTPYSIGPGVSFSVWGVTQFPSGAGRTNSFKLNYESV